MALCTKNKTRYKNKKNLRWNAFFVQLSAVGADLLEQSVFYFGVIRGGITAYVSRPGSQLELSTSLTIVGMNTFPNENNAKIKYRVRE